MVSSFNSGLVRLIERLNLIVYCQKLSFNSGLVRLIGTKKNVDVRDQYVFQFRFGAIDSVGILIYLPIMYWVSIPVWCD